MGTDDRASEPLPVRTSRFRPTGRHRSQHQLSVPPEAPALVLAVPGSESAASNDVASGVAAAARASCPGVAVRYGYLRGEGKSLGTVLAGFRGHEGMPSAVVVPLLICPDAEADADLGAAIEAGSFPVILAKPLGAHPVLAVALHTRLSEAGLAHVDQIGQMTVATAAEGVMVAALGAEALSVAGTAAVLLAARLILPVAAASLDDRASIDQATTQLREAGVRKVALAPCVIGPEFSEADVAALAAETGLKSARPLGAHPALGQLAAMRYGAALQDPQLADKAGLTDLNGSADPRP
jgi:sirohydrochlorin ferrochelatase